MRTLMFGLLALVFLAGAKAMTLTGIYYAKESWNAFVEEWVPVLPKWPPGPEKDGASKQLILPTRPRVEKRRQRPSKPTDDFRENGNR